VRRLLVRRLLCDACWTVLEAEATRATLQEPNH